MPALFSEIGLSPNSDDEGSSPLLLPAMYAAPPMAAPARGAPPRLGGAGSEAPSKADIRAMRPPGNTSYPVVVWAGAILVVDGPCLEGDGWLKILPLWLPRRLLLASKMQA